VLQRNTSARTNLAFLADTVTSQKIVLQKLSSMHELMDDLAESCNDVQGSDDDEEHGTTSKSATTASQRKMNPDKDFFSSNRPTSVATPMSKATKKLEGQYTQCIMSNRN
jgi:hypothetical protein